jgi:hypothetical protein
MSALVAKSYQGLEQICEPYTVNGRMYVKIRTKSGTEKQVRAYSEKEFAKLYPTALFEERSSSNKSLKEVLGFTKGYITIFAGETYAALEWFRYSPARFHKLFGWYFTSTEELPQDVPSCIEPKQLLWAKVAKDDNTLLPDAAVLAAVNELIYPPSTSQFVGEVGERIERVLTVKRAIPIEGNYAPSTMHVMIDEEGNEFVWVTSARTLEQGMIYNVRGTVKAHKVYQNTRQSYLTRCTVTEVPA